MLMRSDETSVTRYRWPRMNLRKVLRQRWFELSLVIGLPLVSWASYSIVSDRRHVESRPLLATPLALVATPLGDATARPLRTELVVAFIGSTQCAFSKPAAVAELVQAAIDSTQVLSARLNFAFSSSGIAVSSSIGAGVKYLGSIAQFDEVAIVKGRSSSILEVQLSAFGGSDATPQILVVERAAASAGTYSQSSDRVLFRAIGVAEIERWIRRGAPVRYLDSGGTSVER